MHNWSKIKSLNKPKLAKSLFSIVGAARMKPAITAEQRATLAAEPMPTMRRMCSGLPPCLWPYRKLGFDSTIRTLLLISCI